jgi:hypothetical protein
MDEAKTFSQSALKYLWSGKRLVRQARDVVDEWITDLK